MSGFSKAGAGALVTQAVTPRAGVLKINGTATLLTWTTPNDGVMHSFLTPATCFVASVETGGAISVVYTCGGNPSGFQSIFLGGDAAGFHPIDTGLGVFMADPGTVVTVQQSSALTAGGPSTVWASIVGR